MCLKKKHTDKQTFNLYFFNKKNLKFNDNVCIIEDTIGNKLNTYMYNVLQGTFTTLQLSSILIDSDYFRPITGQYR